ncbi:S26 family signal peptidase [Caulobacter rhizosphaerae]|uniref:S26 family signal peptidase n=1 Tax=Caulobacter rhizosphaerae TaxID=2010972 RepID=UPI0013D3A1CF|nr:S26 family signal peptidase [Caulobacter rhizosphaerae]GGL35850.1 chromosome segregation protein ParM [Caulobacter rhizosphaerae]
MNRLARIVMLGLIPAPVAAVQAWASAPLVLVNTSPSEPVGLYIRAAGPPGPGRVIAFRAPAQAYPYVATVLPERARSSILKTVRAGEGDLVCAGASRLAVNGRTWALIAATDRLGRTLPHWRGCRRLVAGEYFVFSSRIPNSFDSRYYGPVTAGDVIGVYKPLLAGKGAA